MDYMAARSRCIITTVLIGDGSTLTWLAMHQPMIYSVDSNIFHSCTMLLCRQVPCATPVYMQSVLRNRRKRNFLQTAAMPETHKGSCPENRTCIGTSSPSSPMSFTSAGTTLPMAMRMTSPGTSWLASICSSLPLRTARALGASAAVSALIACRTLCQRGSNTEELYLVQCIKRLGACAAISA
jgi:hypothetical protein